MKTVTAVQVAVRRLSGGVRSWPYHQTGPGLRGQQHQLGRVVAGLRGKSADR